MTAEARTYDTSNVGLKVLPSKEAHTLDTVNVGLESTPYVYIYPRQMGWGVIFKALVPAGRIGAFSEGHTYDTADVTV
jgi:hypothetical protein